MKKIFYHNPSLLLLSLILVASVCFGIYFSKHPISFQIPSLPLIATPSSQFVFVSHVVDGDTIDVTINGKKTPVRFIGMNAPETYQGKNPECFATEAAMYVKNRIENQQVRLVSDPSQDDTDKYDRLLRYIFLEDGTNLDLELIQGGFAKEYTYKVPYQYQQEFRGAQVQAKIEKKGLWEKCTDIISKP